MNKILSINTKIFTSNVCRVLNIKPEEFVGKQRMKWETFHRCFNNAHQSGDIAPDKLPVFIQIHFEDNTGTVTKMKNPIELLVNFVMGSIGNQLIDSIAKLADSLDHEFNYFIPKLKQTDGINEWLYEPVITGMCFDNIELCSDKAVLHFLYQVPTLLIPVIHNYKTKENQSLVRSELSPRDFDMSCAYRLYSPAMILNQVVSLNLPIKLYDNLKEAAKDNDLTLLDYLQTYFTKQMKSKT